MSFLNEKKYFDALKKVECFVLDMDGTFNLGERLIDGAMKFYDSAVKSGKRVIFLTNNSSHDGEYYVKKLNRLGCPAKKDDIYTSGMATCIYINRKYSGKRVFLLGNKWLRREFRRHGIKITDKNPDIVAVGFDTELNYKKLCKACDFVRKGLDYIATHLDLNCPTETGVIPDIGAITAFIEASTGREPDIIIGKPHSEIMNGLMEMTRLPKDKIVICGDRLYTDIATGRNFGILSVCVLTGETNPEDIEKSDIKPDLVFESLKVMAEYI